MAVRGAKGYVLHSMCTEKIYLDWIKRYILFHGKHRPNKQGSRF